jgi:prevent-host-death family protein
MQTVQNIPKQIGVTNARTKLSDIINNVQHRGNSYILEKHGKPVVAVVPLIIYNNWKKSREEFFDQVRKMQKEANLSAEEAERVGVEVVKRIRAKNR